MTPGDRARGYARAMVTVRPAGIPDAPAMGRVHVRAWQAAYRGQMPDGYLDGLRSEDRAAHWEGALGREDLRGVILVAERAGEIVGFAVVGPSRDPEGAGELYVINVDPDAWGTGAGRALLEAAQAELARLGFAESVLWVLSGNTRARRFYEIAGWVADGSSRTSEVFGVTVDEVRYRRRSTSEAISSATPAGTE
ncbi:MAG TPA: GNAT family N-acetyltransferase [Actinomycetes bacterium]|nr:GNAT family N-acetyltransferase [Actinomycetes bacterium]